jgi:hypothetical protein
LNRRLALSNVGLHLLLIRDGGIWQRPQFNVHLIVIVDIDEVVRDEVVVGHIPIVQRLDMIKDGLDILDVPRRSHPQLLARILETFGLNVAHLVNGEVALLSPLELLIEEV